MLRRANEKRAARQDAPPPFRNARIARSRPDEIATDEVERDRKSTSATESTEPGSMRYTESITGLTTSRMCPASTAASNRSRRDTLPHERVVSLPTAREGGSEGAGERWLGHRSRCVGCGIWLLVVSC